MKNKFQNSGFTLIELLIGIAIFMIFMSIAVTSYTSLVSGNRTANQTQKSYREIRLVFDTLAQAIRSGQIDYNCIDPTQIKDYLCAVNTDLNRQEILGMLSADGLTRTLFSFDKSTHTVQLMQQTRLNFAYPWSAGNSWEPLTSTQTPIKDFYFVVTPLQNPYEATNAVNDKIQKQPAVSIFLKTNAEDFRTTYSSRTYGGKSIYAPTLPHNADLGATF